MYDVILGQFGLPCRLILTYPLFSWVVVGPRSTGTGSTPHSLRWVIFSLKLSVVLLLSIINDIFHVTVILLQYATTPISEI
jgi:hypothetical protein